MANVTIKDIAKIAGVSKATVSRVLNHPEIVDEETRVLVQKVMRKNNYQPSITARNLSIRKSNMVGVILPQVDNSFFGELLRGVIHVADKNDLTIMCFNSDNSEKKDFHTFEILAAHRVGGVIYVPAISYEEKKERKRLVQYLESMDAQTVIVERDIALPFDGVFFNDCMASYQATTELISTGHRKIAMLNGPRDSVLALEREKGFLKAMEEAGIPTSSDYMMYDDYSSNSAYMETKKMISLTEQPTAVITCDNNATKGFLEAIYERGRSIPKDYHCVALDKVPMLNILGIPYNYIERDAYQMGQKAMEQLINRIAFPDRGHRHIIIESPLIKQMI